MSEIRSVLFDAGLIFLIVFFSFLIVVLIVFAVKLHTMNSTTQSVIYQTLL